MDDHEALLRHVDTRALHFGPWGLGGAMDPDLAERLLNAEMNRLVLSDDVRATVRSQFEKLKELYRNGLYLYASFTHAERDAYRVLETALKVRFLDHYARDIPTSVNGLQQTVQCQNFKEVRDRVTHARRHRGDGLVGHPDFDGSFAALLQWARLEGYFYGQHNRVREHITPKLRNELQHSEFDSLHMPPDVFRTIGLHYEWIQRLWGRYTPGGNSYPGPIARSSWVIGRWPDTQESTWFPLDMAPDAERCERPGGVFYVVLAADREHLADWRQDVEQTSAPADQLWGPGSWVELLRAIDDPAVRDARDEVEVIDRTFYIQVVDAGIGPARRPEHVRVSSRSPSERWYVVRADHPGAARHHVMELLARALKPEGERHALDGPCRRCAAESIMSGAVRETVEKRVRDGGPPEPVRR
jgi:hypothetical protein